ncbi:MAG: 7-carboxy-7-deazaguanine synthase QueE [Endomicrobium sp.]|jgi:organic radical activating enzyme|nr:7-carboxy-7-deazaguanine synthase QueE [Endomicrobium sp.]
MTPLFKKTLCVPIDEIFFSYQGEALFAGLAQIFVRFAGCNIKCNYCDTPKSRKISSKTKRMNADEILKSILSLSKKHKCRNISLTGGEPLIYADFLKDFLPKLKKGRRLRVKPAMTDTESDWTIYLETNGTLPEELKKIINFCDTISMDFKLASHCGRNFWQEHQQFLKISGKKAFVKIVITKTTKLSEIQQSAKIIKTINKHIPLIFQPSLDRGKPLLKTLYKFQTTTLKQIPNVRIMPQLHKIFKIK